MARYKSIFSFYYSKTRWPTAMQYSSKRNIKIETDIELLSSEAHFNQLNNLMQLNNCTEMNIWTK